MTTELTNVELRARAACAGITGVTCTVLPAPWPAPPTTRIGRWREATLDKLAVVRGVGWWLRHSTPVGRWHDEKIRQATDVHFRLGQDIERIELGFAPIHSEYFRKEPADRPTLHIV